MTSLTVVLAIKKKEGRNTDTEIRKITSDEIYNLAIILNDADAWKELMAVVPAEGNSQIFPKFNSDHIRIIEQASARDKRNPAQIFLDEWSTMGKKRPTLGTLLDLLVGAELFRAADYVACNILKIEKPKRPDYGPAASIDISDTAINNLLEKQQMLLQNTFNDPLLLESTSEINKMYFCKDKNLDDNMNNEHARDTAENSLDCGKSADTTMLVVKSDLMKFSTTSVSEAGNKHFTSVSEHDSEEILKETNNPGIDNIQYGYEEIPSQELPVFLLNNSEQSATKHNEKT